MLLDKLKTALNNYDPYGIFRVNTLQGGTMVTLLFLINAIYRIPNFNVTMQLPLYCLMATGMVFGYSNRLKNALIFCIVCTCYAILLSVVHNYRMLTVFTVGACIAFFFALAKKKVPQLLPMIAAIQAVTYTAFIAPYGDWFHLSRAALTLILMGFLTLGLFALFPRIYFFRVWLRIVYFTIEELAEKLDQFNHHDLNSEQLVFKHLSKIHEYTQALGYKEHGFAARRVSIYIVDIYTVVISLVSNITSADKDELHKVSNMCRVLCKGMSDNQPLHSMTFISTTNTSVLLLQKNIHGIIKVWNQLCLKI